MPRMFAPEYLALLRKIGEEVCGACHAWSVLRADGADALWCVACGARCVLTIDERGTVHEHWPKGASA